MTHTAHFDCDNNYDMQIVEKSVQDLRLIQLFDFLTYYNYDLF